MKYLSPGSRNHQRFLGVSLTRRRLTDACASIKYSLLDAVIAERSM